MEARPRALRTYQTNEGIIPLYRWLEDLRDVRGHQKILARIDRARLGNFGDHRGVGAGVTELRLHFGPGYRIYLGQYGETVIILLLGGDKETQNEDIIKAKNYWQDYQKRKKSVPISRL